jgi:hypothetical protein
MILIVLNRHIIMKMRMLFNHLHKYLGLYVVKSHELISSFSNIVMGTVVSKYRYVIIALVWMS